MAKIIEIEKLPKKMQKDIKKIVDVEKSKYEMITLDEYTKMAKIIKEGKEKKTSDITKKNKNKENKNENSL